MSINVNKCNHVSYGEKDNLGTDYYIPTNNIKYVIQKVNHIKDLGVTFDTNLSFQEHMHCRGKINKAYSMIGLIKRNFIHMDYKRFAYYINHTHARTYP